MKHADVCVKLFLLRFITAETGVFDLEYSSPNTGLLSE
jgi:hypothetical protein